MMKKKMMFDLIDERKNDWFDMAFRIFDHPECCGKEYFAAELLEAALEKEGFLVERGVGGLETAFRATWENGIGGPNIGILGEYDALENLGHGCGHHMQTPAAIAAAVAVKQIFEGSKWPICVTIYGTPAEETFGGKVTMARNGCFSELDIVLGTHASGAKAFIGAKSMAMKSFAVTFYGKGAHAAGSPFLGRSAGDAMLLSFNGIEFMREHVKDGTRMHYTIMEALGPANVVPAVAKAGYTLRSKDNSYLIELEERFRKIIQGACLMTETEAKIIPIGNAFDARKANKTLAELAGDNLNQLGIPVNSELLKDSGGSTDFANVSRIVPGALVYLPYCTNVSHSQEWVDVGKTEAAKECLLSSAKVLAGIMHDLICNPLLVKNAYEEWNKTED